MIVFDVITVRKLSFSDLVNGIMQSREITYNEAEKLIPEHVMFGHTVYSNEDDDWAKELVIYLEYERIDCVEIYVDK